MKHVLFKQWRPLLFLNILLMGGLIGQIGWVHTQPVIELEQTTVQGVAVPSLLPADSNGLEPVGDPYAALSANPLFVPGRHAIVSGTDRQHESAGAQVSATLDWRLLGISLSARRGIALVRDDSGRHHTVRMGETWRGWRLSNLDSQQAHFEYQGQTRVLHLNPVSISTLNQRETIIR